MTIDRTSVGCWILKGNPDVFDYFGAVRAQPPRIVRPGVFEGNWTVGNTYRNDLIKKGDLMALWITGPHKPGIHEIGWITSDGPIFWAQGFDRKHAVDPQKAAQPTYAVDYAAIRLEDLYVQRGEMLAEPVLSHCEQFRARQMSNPSYLTPEEAHALADILATRITPTRLGKAHWKKLLVS